MKVEKAQEYFSSYYDGTLEPGIREQFESLLSSNPTISANYASFAQSLDELTSLKDCEIEVPFDLHERIMQRVDKHHFEQRDKVKGNWFSRFRLEILGAAAVMTLAFSLIYLNRVGNGFSAGPGGGSNTPISDLDLSIKDSKLVVTFTPSVSDTLELASIADGKIIQSVDLKRAQEGTITLTNSELQPKALVVETKSSANSLTIIIPGSQRNAKTTGEGTLMQFAVAVSAYYGLPVRLDSHNTNRLIGWTFDAQDISKSQLTKTQLTIAAGNGIVRLSD